MTTHLQRTASDVGSPDWRLTDGLNAKLAALTTLGLEVQWIEASRTDLTRLVVEGGESAIRLDPDPGIDRAWFGDVEIRHCATREDTWVFVKGEVASGEISAHQVTAPEA